MKNRISGYVSYDAYCVSIKWKVAYRSRLFFSHLLALKKQIAFITSYFNNSNLLTNLLRKITSSLCTNPLSQKRFGSFKKKKDFVPTLYTYPKNVSQFHLHLYVVFRYHDISPATNISKHRYFTIDTLPTDILFPHRKPCRPNNPFSVTKRTD